MRPKSSPQKNRRTIRLLQSVHLTAQIKNVDQDTAKEPIILYGSYTCPQIAPARNVLERANASYECVNISRDSAARARVREINDGYESVPTLAFPDGTTLTEPSTSALEAKLNSLDYSVPSASVLDSLKVYAANPIVIPVGVMALVLGLTMENAAFTTIGIVLLIVMLVSMIRNG